MSERSLSRRAVVGVLGLGAASAVAPPVGASVPSSARSTARSKARAPTAGDDVSDVPRRLLAPLAEGARLDRWVVERVLPVQDGALSVVLADAAGQRFQLDVCARDQSLVGARGPAHTEHFDVYLANRGDGLTGTHEDHGLAAMALAEVIRGNEQSVPRAWALTLASRLERARVHVR